MNDWYNALWQRSWRHFEIRLEYHLWAWGVGVHAGYYYDDWDLLAEQRDGYDYGVAWIGFDIGPIEAEFSFKGPRRKRAECEGVVWRKSDSDTWVSPGGGK